MTRVKPEEAKLEGLWERQFDNPRQERAFLSAIGFNVAFAGCRIVTHAIKDGKGPFRNMSAGGRHLHHSTFGIFGLVGVGYVWTYRMAIGQNGEKGPPRWASRTTATLYGVFSALTLDEFALWFDLQDDYWDSAGRKSIDAVALFSSLLLAGLVGRDAIHEAVHALRQAG